MSVEPFNRLVRLTARAFYDDVTAKADHHQPKSGRSDNRGIAVIILDALTRRQWIREEDLAKAFHLQLKQLRRTLQILKDDKLVAKDQRKEIYDVVRYRIHRMKKELKDKLDNSNTVQRYMCPDCGRRYSAFDALQLGSQNDEYFQCENCTGEVVPESDKFAAEEMGDDSDNARRQQREKLKDMFQKIEEQLKPLTLQLARVKDLQVPEFECLQAWEAVANATGTPNGDSSAHDPYKSGGTSLPFLGEPKFEVDLPGGEVKEETGTDATTQAMKILPPWMIKQGMNITKEQRGEVQPESKMDQSSTPANEKKPKVEEEDEKNIQSEYVKAYYAALAKRTQEESERQGAFICDLANGVFEAPSDHQVSMKAKREQDGSDYIEWEETLPIGVRSG